MSLPKEKTIELSKTKLHLLVWGAAIFVALSLFFLIVPEAPYSGNNMIFVRGVALTNMVLFGLCGVYGVRKIQDKTPGLIFSNAGITDNSSAVSAGFVPWSEITGIEIYGMPNQRFVVLKVTNPENYINRGNALRRSLTSANYKMCGSPITIATNTLQIDFNNLIALFNEYFAQYGENTRAEQ